MTYSSISNGWLRDLLGRLRRKTWDVYRGMIRPLTNPTGESRAAFIVGSGRSGTDLLAAKLGQSIDVLLINEDNPAGFDNWRLRDHRTLRDLISESRARVLLFKPIVETHRTMELLEAFPGSRAVFISRNPSDTINSIARFFGDTVRSTVIGWGEVKDDIPDTWSIPRELRLELSEMCRSDPTLHDAAAIYWYVYNAALFSRGLHEDSRVCVLLYEDLVTRPAEELLKACRHLGIRFRSSMTDGIYRSSVKKSPPPTLTPDIGERCTALWTRIAQEARERA